MSASSAGRTAADCRCSCLAALICLVRSSACGPLLGEGVGLDFGAGEALRGVAETPFELFDLAETERFDGVWFSLFDTLLADFFWLPATLFLLDLDAALGTEVAETVCVLFFRETAEDIEEPLLLVVMRSMKACLSR